MAESLLTNPGEDESSIAPAQEADPFASRPESFPESASESFSDPLFTDPGGTALPAPLAPLGPHEGPTLLAQYLSRKDTESLAELDRIVAENDARDAQEAAAQAAGPTLERADPSKIVQPAPRHRRAEVDPGFNTMGFGGMGVLPVGSGLEDEAAERAVKETIDSLPQIPGGALESVQNTLRSVDFLQQWLAQLGGEGAFEAGVKAATGEDARVDLPSPVSDLISANLQFLANLTPQVEKSDATAPSIVRGISRFVTAFLPALSGVGALGVTGRALPAAIASVPATFFSSDADDKTLGNLTQEQVLPRLQETTFGQWLDGLAPGLQEAVLSFTATDPNNSEMKNRLLMVAEDAILGSMVDAVGPVARGVGRAADAAQNTLNPRALAGAFTEVADLVRQAGAGPDWTLGAIGERLREGIPEALRNERGAIGRPGGGGTPPPRQQSLADAVASRRQSGGELTLPEAKSVLLQRLETLRIPVDDKVKIAERIEQATDLDTLSRADGGLDRVQAAHDAAEAQVQAEQRDARAQGVEEEVQGIDREPSIGEGAQGIETESLRAPRSGRFKVPIKSIPKTELELQEFIRGEGGIRLVGEELHGELERLISPRFLRANPKLQNNASGLSLQEMAERASEQGFIATPDKTALLDALDRSKRQGGVFSEQQIGIVEVLRKPSTRRVYQNILDQVADFQGRVATARRADTPTGTRPRPVVHAEAQAMREEGRFTVDDVRALYPGAVLDDTRATALVHTLGDTAKELQELALAGTQSGAVIGSPESNDFAAMFSLFAELDPRRAGVNAEAGRTLGILNDPNSSINRFVNQFRPILEDASEETMQEIMRRVAALPSLEDVLKFSATTSQAAREGVLRGGTEERHSLILEFWINALLSGPQTQVVNALGNSAMAAYALPERLASSMAGLVQVGSNAIPVREVLYLGWGMTEGILDGFRAIGSGALERYQTALHADSLPTGARSVLRERRSAFERASAGDDPLSQAVGGETKIDINAGRQAITGQNVATQLQNVPRRIPGRGLAASAGRRLEGNIAVGDSLLGTGIDMLGEVVRLPGRSLGASDDFFKSVNSRAQLRALSFRQAFAEEGLRGRAMRERMADLINHPEGSGVHMRVHEEARDFAAIQTFTNQLGPAGVHATLMLNHAPVLRFAVPFLRTPINIAKHATRRTPLLQEFNRGFRADLAAGGARAQTARAQRAIALTMGLGVYALVQQGLVTGGGPRHPGLLRQLESEGYQRYSIKFGEEWVAYNRLDPFGMSFGLVADFIELMGNAEDGEKLEAIPAAIAASLRDNLLSKTYLKGLSEVLTAISPPHGRGTDPTGSMTRFGRRFLTSFMPNLFRQAARTSDGIQRETFGLIDEFRAGTPGLSESLTPRRNLWGDPVYLHPGLLAPMISPVYSSTSQISLASEVLAANDFEVRLPPKKVSLPHLHKRIELTAEEHEAFSLFSAGKGRDEEPLRVGETLQEEIETLGASKRFQEKALSERQEALSLTISRFRESAKTRLRKEFPGLEDRYLQALEAQSKTGSGGINRLLQKQLRSESSAAGVGFTTQ